MQKIKKFHFGETYVNNKKSMCYDLIYRKDMYLIFSVHKKNGREMYKCVATSIFKADEKGAFEQVITSRGDIVRSDKIVSSKKMAA